MTYMSSPDLIGADQVAAILGLSARTVKRLAKAKKIPVALKMTGDTAPYIFDRAEIIAFEEARQSANHERLEAAKAGAAS